MTTAKTNYFENLVCNVYRNVTITTFGVSFLSLHTASPTETGSLAAEVGVGAYARQDCEFGTPVSGLVRNSTFKIFFPIATASWGTITDVGVNDASTAGNMLYYGAMAASKLVDTDDQLIFNVDQLSVTET